MTRTVRFDQDLDDAVQALANHRRMSVSALVNRALRHLIEWDRVAELFEMMTFTPALVEDLFEKLSVDEARQWGRSTANQLAKSMVTLMFGEFDVVHVIEGLRRLGTETNTFRFDDRVSGRKHKMVIRHGRGTKWSAYYEGMLRGIFEDGLLIHLDVSTTKDNCLASFTTED